MNDQAKAQIVTARITESAGVRVLENREERARFDGVALDIKIEQQVDESSGAQYECISLVGACDGMPLEIFLSDWNLQSLALQCISLLPDLKPEMPIPMLEDAYRLQVRFLKTIDDRSMKLLIRETEPEDLANFLWFMEDADLTQAVLTRMTQKAGAVLQEDIQDRWRGKPLQQASAEEQLVGRRSLIKVINAFIRLGDEGQIPCYV